MNREGGSTLTIRKSNRVTDGFKGYKATLFAGERAYVEIKGHFYTIYQNEFGGLTVQKY